MSNWYYCVSGYDMKGRKFVMKGGFGGISEFSKETHYLFSLNNKSLLNGI